MVAFLVVQPDKMVFTLRPSTHIGSLSTGHGLGIISGSSIVARIAQGGGAKPNIARPTQMDDFSRLEPSAHMLQWLSDDYKESIRDEIVSALRKQVADCTLDEFNVTSKPQWLTGTVPSRSNPDKLILVRTGVAFEFSLVVSEPNGVSHSLQGVYSWVGINLNDPEGAQQRIWFDLGGTLDEFGSQGALAGRMYFA